MRQILYLIPCTLGETDLNNVLPQANANIITSLKYFIVENIRTTRRFLKKVDRNINIDELEFFELNGHTKAEQISSFLKPMAEGHSMGVISEAGCPAIADPGADVVGIAQRADIRFNGVGFRFRTGDGAGVSRGLSCGPEVFRKPGPDLMIRLDPGKGNIFI